jgi:hypothetical protein
MKIADAKIGLSANLFAISSKHQNTRMGARFAERPCSSYFLVSDPTCEI